jgi:hypothetical protein
MCIIDIAGRYQLWVYTVWGLAEAEGLVLQNDSWVTGVGEHSRW